MWKTDFTVLTEGFVFHRGCGNYCGNNPKFVEKGSAHKVFYISTGTNNLIPVEMWKTYG
jgi:hypothetical protein